MGHVVEPAGIGRAVHEEDRRAFGRVMMRAQVQAQVGIIGRRDEMGDCYVVFLPSHCSSPGISVTMPGMAQRITIPVRKMPTTGQAAPNTSAVLSRSFAPLSAKSV